MSSLIAVHTIADLRALVTRWRSAGERVALVPTMGALHEGHIALTEIARQRRAKTIVSIFVNPTQFAPHEDFGKYPRTFEVDCAKLTQAHVEAVFAPQASEIYPQGFATTISLSGPASADLEDRFRPMVKDLDLPVEIIGAPTIRAPDGLALSSRNAYLTPEERARAPLLQASMQTAARHIKAGSAIEAALEEARTTLRSAGFEIDYLDLRDAISLDKVAHVETGPLRMLAAVRLGKTRLIDNIAV